MFQIGGVSLIRIQVDFQLDALADPDENVFEGRFAGSVDDQLHVFLVGNTVIRRIGGSHVYMTFGADDSLFQFDDPGRPDENTAAGTFELAALPDRGIDAEGNCIGERQFDLAGRSGRTKYPNAGKHPAARSDDHDRFLGREKAVLIQILHFGQGPAFTEQCFNVRIGQVGMPGGDADDELRDPGCVSPAGTTGGIESSENDPAYDFFHGSSIKCRCDHRTENVR